MPSPQSARSLAAIVFTDIVGYSALVHRDDANALRLVEEHFRLVREIATAFGGRVIKTIGDSVHLEFASAQIATNCAIRIQQRHRERNRQVAEDQRFDIRVAAHLGDIEHRGGDTYGHGVNIAARLQPLAPVGGIAVSDDVRRQLPEELRGQFKPLGAQSLKNIATPVDTFVLEPGAIAGVRVDEPAAEPMARPARASRWRYALIGLGIAALIPIAGLVIASLPFLSHKGSGQPAAGEDHDKSIAVLPFTDLSAAHDQEYFADGMAEELLNSLAKIKDLKVAGRTSSFSFKGKNEDLRVIGKALAVANVLEGSIRKQGDEVRVTAQLIQVANGYHLWSETYDRQLKDIFAVQTEIANAVAEQLKLTLLVGVAAAELKPDAPPQGNVEAYQALLQGNYHFERQNPDDLRKAISYFEDALRLEPAYAMAHARLSRAALYLGGYFGGLDAAESAALRAKAHAGADTALRLAPELAEAHVAKCQCLMVFDLKFAEARAECERALQLAPKDAEAVQAQSTQLANFGRLEDSSGLARQAIALDPLSARAYSVAGHALVREGRLDEAEKMYRKVLELQPDIGEGYSDLALVLARRGSTQEAVDTAKKEHTDFWRTFTLAVAHFANGDRAEADAALKRLIDVYAADGGYQIAEVYAFRGQPDKVFEWLERALAVRDPGVGLIRGDSFLAPYASDPRFIAFAKKIGVMQ